MEILSESREGEPGLTKDEVDAFLMEWVDGDETYLEELDASVVDQISFGTIFSKDAFTF